MDVCLTDYGGAYGTSASAMPVSKVAAQRMDSGAYRLTPSEVLGNLLDVLATKGLLTLPEISEILELPRVYQDIQPIGTPISEP